MKTFNNDIERLRKARELLITIDMVNGFVKEGRLAAPSIMRVVPRQIELLREVENDDKTEMMFIRDCHDENSIEFKTYGEHCLYGTNEIKVIDELSEFEMKGTTYFKNSTNLIFAPGIRLDILRHHNLERIRLMGCLSEVCVLNGAIGLRTLFDELNKDIEVCVHADAIDTFNAPGHDADLVTDAALKSMQANGIKILGKRK